MNISQVIHDMQMAGAPIEAIIIAIKAIESVQEEISERRKKEREKKQKQRALSRDKAGTTLGHSKDNPSPPSSPLSLSPHPLPLPPYNPPIPLCTAREKNDFEKIFLTGGEIFPNLVTANTSPIHSWLAAGCDAELDIIPELERQKEKNISGWKYFTAMVMDAKATRLAVVPEGKPKQTSPPWRAGELTYEQQKEIAKQVFGNAN